MKNAQQKPPQNPSKLKEKTQFTQDIFILSSYCAFWRLSVKKENNSGGKFIEERPLQI